MSTDVTTTPRPLTALILALALMAPLAGAAPQTAPAHEAGSPTLAALRAGAIGLGHRLNAWYHGTPPAERIAWGGLVACGLLAFGVTVERMARVRRSRIVPAAFVERFQRRLGEGGLERGKALDYCELNPSPAARVALAAIRRWGRSTTDLERGVSLARQVEVDRLRSHLGTLRRAAAMAPLIGLLGTLTAAGRLLANIQPDTAWGPALAGALAPVTAGVALAIIALLAFDGLTVRAESLAADLDRIGAETIDAIALATPLHAVPVTPTSTSTSTSTPPPAPQSRANSAPAAPARPRSGHGHAAHPTGKTPHSLRFPISRKIEGR